MTDAADDASSNTFNGGFKDRFTGNNYIYGDANGNMTRDNNKDIQSITYNHLNLPTQVLFDHGGSILYTYDATGVKLKKEIFLTIPLVNAVADLSTSYAGNYIYEKDNTGEKLSFFSHAEGYVEKNGSDFDYVYQYKDHLGNIRLSYQDMNNNGSVDSSEIKEENNYYPFGLEHKGYNNIVQNSNSAASKFKYNDVELEEALGLDLYEMEFRMYDPAIGRFTSIDPITHHSYSTYNAFDNNPIFWADPSGADGETSELIRNIWNNSGSGITTWINNGNGSFNKAKKGIYNAMQGKLNKTKEDFEKSNSLFIEEYGSNELIKSSFKGNGKKWRSYKRKRDNVSKLKDIFESTLERFNRVDRIIADFENIDEDGFELMNSLMINYDDLEKQLSIGVEIGQSSTTAHNSIREWQNKLYYKTTITLGYGVEVGSDVFAHELGHIYGASLDFTSYFESIQKATDISNKRQMNYSPPNCQKSNAIYAREANKWAKRYNQLKKI